MDSRDIYNRTRTSIEWEDNWIHIGIGEEIDLDLLQKHMLSRFHDQINIMLKRGRKNSRRIQMNDIQQEVIKLIGEEDFEIWNEEFNRAIRFNKIGVMNKSKNSL